jgi:hypothetical protein
MNMGWHRKQGSDEDDEMHKDTSLGADPTTYFLGEKNG